MEQTAEKVRTGRTPCLSDRINKRLMLVGVILQIVGVIAPAVLTIENFGVYHYISQAIWESNVNHVLAAALRLVLLNTSRAVPHYLGTFFLAESLRNIKWRRWPVVSMVVICVLIPVTYILFDRLYGVHLDFGIPSLTMISSLLVFMKVRFDFVNLFKKVMMLVLLNAAIQFLNVMPALKGLPVGRGEGSYDIKQAADFLQAVALLQNVATVCCLMLLFMVVLLLLLIVDENNIKRMGELREKSEQELMKAQMRVLENRTYKELNHLVHDLKSPLTSVQALVGVVKLFCQERGSEREVNYLNQVEINVDRMSSMISEILNEEHFTVATTGEIVTRLMAHISTAEYVDLVLVDNQIPDVSVEVNITRFSRALVNLIENSFFAVNPETGKIWLKVFREVENGHKQVCFLVQDNGVGIARELLDRVWTEGYSTRGSHGLGLAFVEKVVTQSGGRLTISSDRGQGTQVRLLLPVCRDQ